MNFYFLIFHLKLLISKGHQIKKKRFKLNECLNSNYLNFLINKFIEENKYSLLLERIILRD